ncbi:MAG: signal recognition particle-docking protein FtsY [Desulfobacteraceae bacterium]|nr:MAG: signal recognition particle-docking protein FtsY [Desulfobacteraceae bacterium]
MIQFFKKKEPKREQAEIKVPEREEPRAERNGKGFFLRLREGLSKTRSGFTDRLDRLVFGKKEITGDLLEELEEILLTSDLGVSTTQELIASVEERIARKELSDPAKLRGAVKEQIGEFLEVAPVQHRKPSPGEPLIIMVIGVNGVGKTTTIGKAGRHFAEAGKKVMFVAGDTFRAAAREQLEIWGKRVGAEVVSQKDGSDPSSVVFDALSAAISRKTDVVLVDTAGRLHTKVNLMDELGKIHRVAGKRLPGAPHEIWLVLDATTGQNAVSQAEMFNKSIGVTGLILTKLDGTAKGGVAVAISHQLHIPIKFIGIGEKIDDLRPFHAKDFVEALFG